MSIKKTINSVFHIVLGLFIFSTIISTKVDAQNFSLPSPPVIDAQSWVLMDYNSGQILLSKNPDEKRAPASLTKIMTEYVISSLIKENIIHLNDLVKISKHAWLSGGARTDGSTSFLKVNSEVSLKNLLHGMIIQSGNDAAIALAEHAAGTEKAFTIMMNRYAQDLGMRNTHYSDASGYPIANHYSTARDIAILSRALISNFPDEYAISAVKEFTWDGIKQHNRNTLLWKDSRIDGIKTGHTKAAGYCLDASERRGNFRLIAVVLGASTNKGRADSAMQLLEYGFQYFKSYKLYDSDKPIISPKLWKGRDNKINIGVKKDVLVSVPKGKIDDINTSIDIPNQLIAPYKKGDKVGTLNITLEGNVLKTIPLIILNDAPQGSFISRQYDTVSLWIHTWIHKYL